MFSKLLVSIAVASLTPTLHAQVPEYIGKHEATERDEQAILQVASDFRAALVSKDAKKLSGLLLHSKILFTSPASPARVRKARAEADVHADGVNPAGATAFMNFVAASKEPIEERFHNIKITQDGYVAWVMFDFEFLAGGQVQNHGVETWQMIKTADESWKILSVVWSSRGKPR